jgi:glycosyltransferase involved in cell wall biosynthesis
MNTKPFASGPSVAADERFGEQAQIEVHYGIDLDHAVDVDQEMAAWLVAPAIANLSSEDGGGLRGLGSTRVSIVIPTLNEASNLPHIIPRLPSWVHEVLIVDGRSTDDTIGMARALRPSVRVILQDGRGKGNALACGFAAAEGDIIVMLDADGSTDPAEIPRFVQPLLDGADFVKGSRCLEGGGSTDISRFRSAGNRALTGLVNVLYRTRYTDLCYGYNAFWAHCLPHMQVDCDGFEVETLIHARIARSGLDVREVPSNEHERINGTSNLRTLRDGRRVLRTIVRERLARRGCRTAPKDPQTVYAHEAPLGGVDK